MIPDRFFKYALLFPAFVICAATLFYPLLQSFWYSLHDWNLGREASVGNFVGLENYWSLITEDPAFWTSVKVTLIFTIPSVFLTIAASLGMAMLLTGTGALEVNARTLLVIPFAMSPALIGVSWRFLLNPEFGAADAVLKAIFPALADTPILSHPTLAMVALIAVDLWHWVPYFMLTFIGALAGLPQDTIDAAEIDGAGPLRTFFDVILPQLFPVVAIALLLKTIFSLKTLDQVVTMTAGGPGTSTDTLSHMIFTTSFRWYDIGYGSAIAYLLAIVMMILALMYSRFVLGNKP
ncbi:MAG: sugar ABC transporter permease [Rubrivivax sp.]